MVNGSISPMGPKTEDTVLRTNRWVIFFRSRSSSKTNNQGVSMVFQSKPSTDGFAGVAGDTIEAELGQSSHCLIFEDSGHVTASSNDIFSTAIRFSIALSFNVLRNLIATWVAAPWEK